MSSRMRKALDRVEARRIALESQIIDELEERFFAETAPEVRESVIHLGAAAMNRMEGTCTGSASHFSTTWFA